MTPVICLQWKSSKLGCCYWNDNEIFAMQDVWESNSLGYVRTLIAQIDPQAVIVPDSSDDLLCQCIVEYNINIKIKKVKPREFQFNKGKLELLNWFIQYRMDMERDQHFDNIYKNIILTNVDQDEKMHALLKLEGMFRLEENKKTVGCLGVLLNYIRDEIDETENENSLTNMPTLFSSFSCASYVQIDSDTLRSLCVFESETHPSMHQKIGKESLSLFGLLDKTSSVLGKQLLKEWVSRPTMDTQIHGQRHEAIRYFISRKDVMDRIRSDMRYIKNIKRILSKLQENKGDSHDWKCVIEFAYHAIGIHTILNHLGVNISIIQRVKESIPISVMRDISNEIQRKISFEMSDNEGRVTIQSNIDYDLDLLRERYTQLDNYLLQVAHEISKELPIRYGATLNVVYFPQLGYLVTLPRTYSENIVMDGFELQFVTHENYYYKNNKTNELDNTIGDIHGMIMDKEIEIIQGLSDYVLQYQNQMLECVRAISELDCIISLAIVASSFNYVEPSLTTTENKIIIVQGRHPLQELCMDIFIPNDTFIQSDSQTSDDSTSLDSITRSKIQILSGANFSGKSVYLKQVGLIVYMAHIGSFVPAESAVIGITDKIFTRIQTSETVSKPQSAFAFDVQQLNRAIIGATCRSLVIIDEFGKGTNSLDGSSLFGAIIRHFLSQDENCPKVLASTHFHDLLANNILAPQDNITFSTTEILNQIVNGKSQVIFLYRIVPGTGDGKSYGIWCASIAGITNSIIERAIELANNFSEGTQILRVMDCKEKEVYEQLEVLFDKFVKTEPNQMDWKLFCDSVSEFLN